VTRVDPLIGCLKSSLNFGLGSFAFYSNLSSQWLLAHAVLHASHIQQCVHVGGASDLFEFRANDSFMISRAAGTTFLCVSEIF